MNTAVFLREVSTCKCALVYMHVCVGPFSRISLPSLKGIMFALLLKILLFLFSPSVWYFLHFQSFLPSPGYASAKAAAPFFHLLISRAAKIRAGGALLAIPLCHQKRSPQGRRLDGTQKHRPRLTAAFPKPQSLCHTPSRGPIVRTPACPLPASESCQRALPDPDLKSVFEGLLFTCLKY